MIDLTIHALTLAALALLWGKHRRQRAQSAGLRSLAEMHGVWLDSLETRTGRTAVVAADAWRRTQGEPEAVDVPPFTLPYGKAGHG